MTPRRGSALTRILLAVLFLSLAGYAYYELRGFLHGPRIVLPEQTLLTSDTFVIIRGSAMRISTLEMNGVPISVTEDGQFEEPYLLSPGLNRLVFDAKDKYGRASQEELLIVYKPLDGDAAPTLIPAATSTDATTEPRTVPETP